MFYFTKFIVLKAITRQLMSLLMYQWIKKLIGAQTNYQAINSVNKA